MSREKGWKDGDYYWDYDEAWDFACDIFLEYNGHNYRISLEEDKCVYDLEDGDKVIKRYESKEEFYNSMLFGRPIKEVIDNSYILSI